MSRAGVLVAAAPLLLLAACAGGEFHVESPLKETAPLPISGTLGMNIVHCRRDDGPVAHGLVADQPAGIAIGDLRGITSEPHREAHTTKLFGEALLRDYKRFLERYGLAGASRAGEALARFSGDDAGARSLSQLDDLFQGISFLLAFPRETTETMTFTFLATRESRTIAVACASTDVARTLGFFDGPRFSMSCRIVSSADAVPRDLRVVAHGTWSNYGYSGALATPSGEGARFASQNVTVLGMGAVRGFDLRSADRGQLAAVSFWHVPGAHGKTEPRAWLAEGPTTVGFGDALMTTLALAYVFPWPTGCDDQYLREEGMKTIGPAMR
jgi:hypothetical protein